MIADSTSARSVSEAAEQFLHQLSEAFELERGTASPADFERLKQAVGVVVGTLEVELLWPLYKQHPDLEPDNLKNWEARS